MDDRKFSKTHERLMAQMINEMQDDHLHLTILSKARSLIPEGWDDMDQKAPVSPKKTRITTRLDEDVAKWFRNLGTGYQGRINAVLRAYMLAVLSKCVEEAGDRDWRNRPI